MTRSTLSTRLGPSCSVSILVFKLQACERELRIIDMVDMAVALGVTG